MAKRIVLDQCCGVIIDVQEFFLAQLPKRRRAAIETNTRNFATLLGYLRIPIVVTIERPLDAKGNAGLDTIIITGGETDVCVLQSCLGLLGLGFEVFVVEELIFSGARNVESALARMKDEGAVFLTYKTLYYELFRAVEGNPRTSIDRLGPYPEDLPDIAVE